MHTIRVFRADGSAVDLPWETTAWGDDGDPGTSWPGRLLLGTLYALDRAEAWLSNPYEPGGEATKVRIEQPADRAWRMEQERDAWRRLAIAKAGAEPGYGEWEEQEEAKAALGALGVDPGTGKVAKPLLTPEEALAAREMARVPAERRQHDDPVVTAKPTEAAIGVEAPGVRVYSAEELGALGISVAPPYVVRVEINGEEPR